MNSMLNKRGALMGLSVMVSGFVSGGVFAQDLSGDAPSITIRYSDLDLAQPSGVQVLYRRIATAAKVVCDHGNSRELARVVATNKCVDHTLSQAIEEIDMPQLSALHRMNRNHDVG